ncbi:hypothetical protein HK405_007187, partial [Cladochytrium tenue]
MPFEFCVRHLGKRHRVGNLPYTPDPDVSVKDPVYVSDTTFLPEPQWGWLNLPALETLTSVLLSKQSREWYIVGFGDGVDPSYIVNNAAESPVVPVATTALPLSAVYFPPLGYAPVTSGTEAGILDSCEKRNDTTPESLDGTLFILQNSFATSVQGLDASPLAAVGGPTPRAAMQLLADAARATAGLPHGAIYFDSASGARLDYTLQMGSDARTRAASAALGYPTGGFRRLLAQARLSSGLLRAAWPARLGGAAVTTSLRAFPALAASLPAPGISTLFGSVLYPMGVSFLLPIMTFTLVQERESKHGAGKAQAIFERDPDIEAERNFAEIAAADPNALVAIHGVSIRGSNGALALSGMNLVVRRGEAVALLGPNGAGKTTLLEVLVGLRKALKGSARLAGELLSPESASSITFCKGWKKTSRVGVCPQHDLLWEDLSPREHLQFYARVKTGQWGYSLQEAVENTLVRTGIVGYADNAVKHLSGGQRRRLSIAIALVGNPSVIVLDEPT